MEESEKNEIIEYAVKMRERGETYRSIHNYLNQREVDDDLRRLAIAAVSEMEKANGIERPRYSSKRKITNVEKICGALIMVVSALSIVYLWGKGWVLGASFAGIFIGLGVMTGTARYYI